MSTPPFEVTGNKEGSNLGTLKSTPEKQLPEKFLKEKLEKLEKIEHKEKPEKVEHKEKPEKFEHKEKPEKFEHKEKPEKFEHKEKPEKFEHKEKIEIVEKVIIRDVVEKPELLDHPGKIYEGPQNPGIPIEGEGLAERLGRLEQTVGQLQHFITTNLRPDLSRGALKQEPDEKSRKA
jgi:hypothetical protein